MRKELRMGRPAARARSSCFSSFRGPFRVIPKGLLRVLGTVLNDTVKKARIAARWWQNMTQSMGEENRLLVC